MADSLTCCYPGLSPGDLSGLQLGHDPVWVGCTKGHGLIPCAWEDGVACRNAVAGAPLHSQKKQQGVVCVTTRADTSGRAFRPTLNAPAVRASSSRRRLSSGSPLTFSAGSGFGITCGRLAECGARRLESIWTPLMIRIPCPHASHLSVSAPDYPLPFALPLPARIAPRVKRASVVSRCP